MIRLNVAVAAIWTLALLAVPWTASAQEVERPIGVGIVLGDPVGVTAKIWLDQRNALQANLGWRSSIYGTGYYYHWFDANAPYFSLDWVHHHRWIRSRRDTVAVGLHWGIGAGLDWLPGNQRYYYLFGDHYVSGGAIAPMLRIPLGFDLEFPRGSFELFAEVVPILQVVFASPVFAYPDIMFDVGGRFYF